jgi:hypothetical protein
MIGDQIKGYTVQVGSKAFVVHDGGVYRAEVRYLRVDDRASVAGVRITKPRPNTWDDVELPLHFLHDSPEYACRQAFSGPQS